ncbi:glycosyltransferase [Halalkalibacter nanhaiisediminis]|uniref:glycosyltransferase n=1 Tax=Halalkalibacter nanhaiisediminis TaxID=688079 RepID=UPI0013159B7F|nr:glycosyltransferase [Halalkalibacter nanhaiisediminis]
MKILVLATDYSRPDGIVSLHYIHTRNRWYLQKGIDVSVVSFNAKSDYTLEGVKVYTLKTYEKQLKNVSFDLLISHAPNLRNHYRFLKKYGENFNNVVFFFHGHEVLRCSEIYPKPYSFVKKSPIVSVVSRELYDLFKLRIWRSYFSKMAYKSHFVFVSHWMFNMFIKFVKVDRNLINPKKSIIYNSVGENFEKVTYDTTKEKKYDFITIRNMLDGSKYSIDIVTRVAKNNPEYTFCVVGKGKFYEYNKKPDNLIWIDKNLTHKEVIEMLNESRCALIPTRADAQGVMACEMATFGIPVITSRIDVCEEIFSEFENVGFIDNQKEEIDIEPIYKKLNKPNQNKNEKYFSKNTIEEEVKLFYKLRGSQKA